MTPYVHYGRWRMPDGRVCVTKVITLPREGENYKHVLNDLNRAAWPSL